MSPYVKDYKRIANCTGLCLCIFIVMFYVTNTAVSVFSVLPIFMGEDLSYSIISVAQMIAYLSSFIIPAIILRSMLKRFGLLQPLRLDISLPLGSLLLIPAAIALALASSYVNSWLLLPFDISDAYYELLGMSSESYAAYEILIMFVSTAVVPAVCEEFLFRGAVLSSLMPFGRGVALVGSSVLFGLMHQNPYQMLYTTVAGLLIGYAYIKTRSIWCPMIIHFCNNAFSVTEQVIGANCRAEVSAVLLPVMDTLMLLGGFICLAIYLLKEARLRRERLSQGSFGVIIEESDSYAAKPISPADKLRCFFAPGMIVFVVLALISVISTLLLLVLFSGMLAVA